MLNNTFTNEDLYVTYRGRKMLRVMGADDTDVGTDGGTATATKDDAAATATTTGETDDKTKDQKVPYSRFEEVNKRARQAEQELEDLRQKIIEFEDRDKSELDRAKDRASRAETALEQLSGKVTAMEKGAWVRSAAAELNFHDPEDAVAALNLATLEDERHARREVDKLAKRKEHLVRQQKKEERPAIGRVFGGDQVTTATGTQQQQPQLTAAQMAMRQNAEAELQFAESLKEQLNNFRSNWHDGGKVV
jgi:hypothetical protein